MIALTCDFHVLAARVATRFSAVFFSVSRDTKTRYMRAQFRVLIRHYKSVLSSSDPPAPITEALRFLT
jgi:hypothetical protein